MLDFRSDEMLKFVSFSLVVIPVLTEDIVELTVSFVALVAEIRISLLKNVFSLELVLAIVLDFLPGLLLYIAVYSLEPFPVMTEDKAKLTVSVVAFVPDDTFVVWFVEILVTRM